MSAQDTTIETHTGTYRALGTTDPEELFISRITRHDNGNCCCGTCEPDFCFGCGHFSQFCTCWPGVTINSPNFCDHRSDGEFYPNCGNKYQGVECKHTACNAVVPF